MLFFLKLVIFGQGLWAHADVHFSMDYIFTFLAETLEAHEFFPPHPISIIK